MLVLWQESSLCGAPLAWRLACICQRSLMPVGDRNQHSAFVQPLEHFLSGWEWWTSSEFDELWCNSLSAGTRMEPQPQTEKVTAFQAAVPGMTAHELCLQPLLAGNSICFQPSCQGPCGHLSYGVVFPGCPVIE